MASIAYCLFGVGLAFYATPSTDAALANLPAQQAGAGAGISEHVPDHAPRRRRPRSRPHRQRALRLAAMVAIGVNLVFVLLAILIITLMVPTQSGRISPKPQLPPDAATAAEVLECPLCHGEGLVKEDVPSARMPAPRDPSPSAVTTDGGVTT
jgi:DHA2 family multidrug resistance protein-like MFS transporter